MIKKVDDFVYLKEVYLIDDFMSYSFVFSMPNQIKFQTVILKKYHLKNLYTYRYIGASGLR